MMFSIVLTLVFLTLIAAQDNGQAVRGCLSKCDQGSALWMTCATECVDTLHSINKNDVKDCLNQCGSDGHCLDTCIGSHFPGSNSDDSQPNNPPDTNTKVTIDGNPNPGIVTSRTGATISVSNTNGQPAKTSGQSDAMIHASSLANPTTTNPPTPAIPKSEATKNGIIVLTSGMTILGLAYRLY
ncbi:hypothetical protein K7432_008250 [Basidiobolus ranarum]|uniref:Uncharacterized protein n=1 Tax=Basidiobolus ranarum TaxID=34480 RepID=A0ABR2VZ36_9FUNG